MSMKLRWMFRATELVTGQALRGTLAVYATPQDEWRAIFTPDQRGLSRLEIERPLLHFRTDDGRGTDLPERASRESRELGEVAHLSLTEISLKGEPRYEPTFLLHGRLPATADTQVTATVSVRAPVGVRGG